MLFTRILTYSSRIRSRFPVRFGRGYNDIAFDDLPEVSTSLIRKTLRSNNNFEEGYTCFLVPCKFCGKHVKTAKVYVNKTTGMYMCSCSKTTGHWSQFEQSTMKVRKRSKDCENGHEVNHISETLEGIKRDTTEVNLLLENELKSVLRKFNLPVVSLESLSNVDVRIDSKKSSLYFPLENVESNIVGYKKLSLASGETVTLPNVCGGLLTSRTSTKSKDTAIVVPNIADFLVLLNSKLSVSVVCLPNGVDSLSQYCLPSFERFKKLILWLGNDDKSWNVARHFARKLEEKRCLLVRPTDKQDLPHLKPDQDFKSVISNAQQMWHKSVTTFSSLRADVYSDLLNIDKVQGVKWKRFPALNKILKGHRRGELTVITGPTGSGKTTFISEYSLDLAMQGVNTLWGSFEIRNARLAKTMLQQMAGFPLDEQLNLFDTWADRFEKLPVYFMTFHGQQAVKVVMEAVEQATYIYDIAHVIIDNVQFMMGMSEEQKHVDRFWKQDMVIGAFRQFATRKNCHVTLVIHPRKERNEDDLTTSSIFGGAKASQEADNVLIIQDKRLMTLRGKKYLQVAKNRYSGDLGIMALDFDKDGLSYQQKKSRDRKNVEEQTLDKGFVG